MAVVTDEDFAIVAVGDSAYVVEFAPRLDPAVNARVIALWHHLRQARVPGVRDLVPAYRSLGVHLDPLRTDVRQLVETLRVAAAGTAGAPVVERPPVRIPVCYGGDCGPDLEIVASAAGLSPSEVIAVHSARVYRVFMLGFSPGFAYMGSVDPRIAIARRATPRVRVPVGSVGVAGRQTGIYPSETPGGWMLVGRTPVRPFDARRARPFLFEAGDAVQFVPIDVDEFRRAAAEAMPLEP